MPLLETHITAIKLLVQVEEATGALYAVYAERFPAQAPFWQRLVSEEEAHAIWVRTLLDRLREGTVHFKEGRLSPDVYQTFLGYLNNRIAEATAHPLTLIEALSIAVDIESTFVERNFFEVFAGTAPDATQILARLTRGSEEHLKRLRDTLRLERIRPTT